MNLGLLAALAAIAFLYASVGHGGASGYLALLALMGHTQAEIRPSALVLNLFVSGVATVQFARAGHFRWHLFWPFAATSIPLAWLGATITLDPLLYKRALALCLLVAVARLLGLSGKGHADARPLPLAAALGIGAVLGMVSGMIGIGGGILLSPLLLVFGWANAKETAAVSAPFILVNSAAGLIGALGQGEAVSDEMLHWVAVALVGGALGSYVGARLLNDLWLRRTLGAVLLFASIKLMLP